MEAFKNNFIRSNINIGILRLGLFIVFAVFGLYKYFAFEAQMMQHLTQGT